MQTNDLQVLGVMSAKNPRTSAVIAEKLGITPFQITARLASMEKRGLAKRVDGRWIRVVTVDEAKTMSEKVRQSSGAARGTIIVDASEATMRRDAKAPIITYARGWTVKTFWMTGDQRVQIFTTPAGQHYVYAEPSEPADLLIDYRERELGLIRMKIFNRECSAFRRLYRERGRELANYGYIS